jgi:hypothetical protein
MVQTDSVVQAQGTILPKAGSADKCDEVLKEFSGGGEKLENVADGMDKILGCAIKTGRISLPMVPHFIKYFSNYLLGMIGLVSLLFTVLGGVLYVRDKDKGKKYITNALTGMGIAFLAWTIVNVIMAALTG